MQVKEFVPDVDMIKQMIRRSTDVPKQAFADITFGMFVERILTKLGANPTINELIETCELVTFMTINKLFDKMIDDVLIIVSTKSDVGMDPTVSRDEISQIVTRHIAASEKQLNNAGTYGYNFKLIQVVPDTNN